jgi:hypothetical protein
MSSVAGTDDLFVTRIDLDCGRVSDATLRDQPC